MINWNRCSVDQIKQKWADFNFSRNYPYKCVKKAQQKNHITCLERESLINNLLKRLDNAQEN